jgi:hypothetical protein
VEDHKSSSAKPCQTDFQRLKSPNI